MDFRELPRIRIEIKGDTCTKECPYIGSAEADKMPLPGTMVGSFLCRRCTYFKMVEPRSNRVVCSFEDRNAEKNVQ